jgi:plastocyanin
MKLILVVLLMAAAFGIAFLAVAGSGTRSGPFGDSVDLVIDDLRFTPNRVDARVGVPMTVRMISKSPHAHDVYFSSRHMPGLQGRQSYVAPGETQTLTLRFDRSGTHTFSCSQPGHAASGMTGAVFVRP